MLWGVHTILPRFDFKVSYAAAQDQGRTRQNFEDAHLLAANMAVFAVADGMGGHAGGEVAARLAVATVEESFRGPRTQLVLDAYAAEPGLERRRQVLVRLRRAVEQAHVAIQKEAEACPELLGMGTTLDVVCLLRNKAFVAHVGDGRVYLSRPQATIQLTQDHTDFDLMKARGQLRPQARLDRRNRLASAVGIGESVSVDTLCVEVARGDRLLLCSDGVHGQVHGEAQLSGLLRRGGALEAARMLIAAVAAQGRDNATAVVLEIGEAFVKRPEGDRALMATDLRSMQMSVLLHGLAEAAMFSVLAAAVEVECKVGESVPQAVANDLVAYIVLDGLVELSGARVVTTGALLFPESLVGVAVQQELPTVRQQARLMRIRCDDFAEVCSHDAQLGAELYKRLAEHLARRGAPNRGLAALVSEPQGSGQDLGAAKDSESGGSLS